MITIPMYTYITCCTCTNYNSNAKTTCAYYSVQYLICDGSKTQSRAVFTAPLLCLKPRQNNKKIKPFSRVF